MHEYTQIVLAIVVVPCITLLITKYTIYMCTTDDKKLQHFSESEKLEETNDTSKVEILRLLKGIKQHLEKVTKTIEVNKRDISELQKACTGESPIENVTSYSESSSGELTKKTCAKLIASFKEDTDTVS